MNWHSMEKAKSIERGYNYYLYIYVMCWTLCVFLLDRFIYDAMKTKRKRGSEYVVPGSVILS